MSHSHWVLVASIILLVITKVADVWTTILYVGHHGESNPLARCLFEYLGFYGGLATVMFLWAGIVATVFVSAWTSPMWIRILTAITGMAVAWVQCDVARFNATHRSSRLTRFAARAYGCWSSWLKK